MIRGSSSAEGEGGYYRAPAGRMGVHSFGPRPSLQHGNHGNVALDVILLLLLWSDSYLNVV